MLNFEKFQVHSIRSFSKKKDWSATNFFDLLPLERNQPDGVGLEILKIYQRTENTRAIILPSAGKMEDRIKCMNAVDDYFLVKPISGCLDSTLALNHT